MKLFLKWLLQFLTVCFGLFVCQLYGIFEYLWDADKSKISFMILVLYLLSSCRLGALSFVLSRRNSSLEDSNVVSNGWFMSNFMMALGIFSTVLGFAMLLGPFAVLNMSSPESMQKLVENIGPSLSVALLPTLCGIASANLLRVQCQLVENKINSEDVGMFL